MYTPEDRLLSSLRSIMGTDTEKTAAVKPTKLVETEKVAEEATEEVEPAQEPVEEETAITKIAEMSVDSILNDPTFLKGVSDRIGQRSHEIEAALHLYMSE